MIGTIWLFLIVITFVQIFGLWGSGAHKDEKIKWHCLFTQESDGKTDHFRFWV